MTLECVPGIEARLDAMETMLEQIHSMLAGPKGTREWYTVDEAATLVNKNTYTVREWCRQGRINATKRPERRGGAELWNISASEVVRYKDEGLLPPDPHRNVGN
jgi:excisionase family DNA binding protein